MFEPFRYSTALAAAASILLLAGCGDGSAANDTSAITSGTSNPCRLLSDAEVAAVFRGSKSGIPERTREKYGITACVWSTPGGSFAVQLWTGEPGTAEDEIRGLMIGIVDPLKPSAQGSVRFETVDVGERAMVAIEKQDAQRGILNDAAVLVTQRGEQILVLQSTELARRERPAALAALTSLAKQAVSRLP
jgi:hypothetical protein